ncbi:L-galactose dehydrogenase-like, partial [Limulus polyphemus]|uniref:L-galactose dehydrogenase-like n=1 Tax=Limulus polyphemus TaxID=6850 RepID=A0ABM1BYY7_LIMPO
MMSSGMVLMDLDICWKVRLTSLQERHDVIRNGFDGLGYLLEDTHNTGNMLPQTFIPGFHSEVDVRKMTYKSLGTTGMLVSYLSLGTFQLGLVYQTSREEDGIKTVREAVRRGLNYIDTSPWYGFGTAEIVLGKALKGIPRQAYYLGTKVGRYHPEYPKMFDFSAERTIQSVEESLEKLGVDYVDVIQ